MPIEQEIADRLRALNVAGGRIYPMRLQQGSVLPAAVYSVVSKTRLSTRSGVLGLVRMRLQLAVVAKTYSGAKTEASSVRSALQDYEGGSISTVLVSGDRDYYEADTEWTRVVMDVLVTYREG